MAGGSGIDKNWRTFWFAGRCSLGRSVGFVGCPSMPPPPRPLLSFLFSQLCMAAAVGGHIFRVSLEETWKIKFETKSGSKGRRESVVSLSCGMPLASDKGRRVECYWIISLSDYYAIFLVNSQISATLTGLLKPFENSLFTLLLSSCSHNLFAKF